MSTHTEDSLLTNPKLVEIVEGEAKRVAKALRLDVVDAKEVYRSMVNASIQVALAIADGEPAKAIEFDFEAHRGTTYRCTIHRPQHIHITPVDRIRTEGPSFTSNDGILYPPKDSVK